ncbi:MAG: hypothetical protein ACUVQ9_09565 [Thermodesulfobacteriota bacterium]
MRKYLIFFSFFVWIGIIGFVEAKDLEIKGKQLVSLKPPFTMRLSSEFRLIHSFSHENPRESSQTRGYIYIKDREKRVEEMLILQIADKTNPQASPMTAPPLKPYTERRSYTHGKLKKGDLEIEYLIQLMAWNPKSPSLQPLIQKGISVPHHWALQGQFQFIYLGEHGVLLRYSKALQSFGLKISEEGKDWEKITLSKNEKKVYEIFQKSFMEMIDSIELKEK